MFLKISENSLKGICDTIFSLIKKQVLTLNFIKKETLAQVFPCEFWEISKNTFFYRTPLVAASVSKGFIKVFMAFKAPAFYDLFVDTRR